jgi:hypothetical protein
VGGWAYKESFFTDAHFPSVLPLPSSISGPSLRKNIGIPPTIVKSENTGLLASARSVRRAGFSGAGFLEEPVIERRLLDLRRRLFRRRADYRLLPEPTVLQNLLG